MAIASLILGIISLVLSFFGLGIISVFTAIIGIILGVPVRKDLEKKYGNSRLSMFYNCFGAWNNNVDSLCSSCWWSSSSYLG